VSLDTRDVTHVFLKGDPAAIPSTLTVDEIAAKIADAELMADGQRVPFVRFAGPYGEILVRPDQIVALLPCNPDEDD
jgi:hypothetical protein